MVLGAVVLVGFITMLELTDVAKISLDVETVDTDMLLPKVITEVACGRVDVLALCEQQA